MMWFMPGPGTSSTCQRWNVTEWGNPRGWVPAAMSFVVLAPLNGPETPSLTVETLCFGFGVLYTPPSPGPCPLLPWT